MLFRGLTGNLLGILNYGTVNGTGAGAPTARISSQLGLLVSYAQIRITSASGCGRSTTRSSIPASA